MDSEVSNMNKKEKIVGKLFKWEGKKELIWVAFIALVLLSAWAYKRDTALCKKVAIDPCTYCDAERQGETGKSQPVGFRGIETDLDGGDSKHLGIG